MKLRIRGSSLRLRLTRGEVAALRESGRVEDRAVFAPGAELVYALVRSADAPGVAATFVSGRVLVTVPDAVARAFCDTDQVGFDAEQVAGATTLRILVEKDFACLKPREGESEDDAFPHPDGAC